MQVAPKIVVRTTSVVVFFVVDCPCFSSAVSFLMHFRPDGSISVLLYSNWPKICACTDSFVFILEFLRRLAVMIAFGMNESHSVIGKDGSVPLIPDMR